MSAFQGTSWWLIAPVAVWVAAQSAVYAQNPPDKLPMARDVFKNVMMLGGIPVDTFFEAMGMFANSMGSDCTFCHSPDAPFDRAAFAVQTPRIQRARQMIAMMNGINKQYFGGQPRVTCFTCHSGSQSPASDPDIALQYSAAPENPNVRNLPPDLTGTTADQVFDKYIQALGGADRLAAVTSFVAKGTYTGFDTGRDKVPVDVYANAPNQLTTIVHFPSGPSTRTYDGRSGWMAGRDTPIPLLALTGGNLDRARLEAMLWFPGGIRRAFSQWKVGRVVIDDEDVQVVQGSEPGQAPANFYFNASGLLVRVVRWTQTPVGFVPTQVDYADYREVAAVKVPFRRTVSQTYMQMTIELTDVQPNVRIDRSKFAQPGPY